jgi:hypothetical protein
MWTILSNSQSITPTENKILIPGEWTKLGQIDVPTWWRGELVNNLAPATVVGVPSASADTVRFLNISCLSMLDSTGMPYEINLGFGTPLPGSYGGDIILLSGHQEYCMQINHQQIYFAARTENGIKADCPISIVIELSIAPAVVKIL